MTSKRIILNILNVLLTTLVSGSSMRIYSIDEGEKLVKAARYSMELYITSREFKNEVIEKTLPDFTQKYGVFVTIYHYPTKTLRGCIGFTEGIGEVKKLLVEAAIAAATEDPRFVEVSHREFGHMVLSISVLSRSEKIHGSPEEIKKQIKIGRDGLILEYGYYKGLLLPIVAVEEGWSPEKFLDNLCLKAGLPEHTWKQSGVSIYKFSAQVFEETEPSGRIKEVRSEEL